MTKRGSILVVEDEEPIRQGLVDLFVFHGFTVQAVADGRSALRLAMHERFDLILLDVMLPELDGFSVCNEIRKVSRDQPIILLTAKTSDEDIVTGLTLGADDYVAKPFSVRELVLRVESVLRRARKGVEPGAEIVVGDINIDIYNMNGIRKGGTESILFTRREIEILQYLLAHGERPVSRDELLSEVWGYAKDSTIETRTVDIHIAKLRKKIEPDSKQPSVLVTVRGEGYKISSAGR
jgi:DNA-binding response OmpR family regulator